MIIPEPFELPDEPSPPEAQLLYKKEATAAAPVHNTLDSTLSRQFMLNFELRAMTPPSPDQENGVPSWLAKVRPAVCSSRSWQLTAGGWCTAFPSCCDAEYSARLGMLVSCLLLMAAE